MRVLAIVIASLLLLESFYLVECSDRDRGPKYKHQPYCRQFCNGPGNCGPPCPNCKGNWWNPNKCE
uniref:Putative secreted protein n=1 Tax=Ixodes scapularis TaxID=6945 RepID=Q4PMK9_IXOSC|nr:putative secreted protein [Ixodes scapularis]